MGPKTVAKPAHMKHANAGLQEVQDKEAINKHGKGKVASLSFSVSSRHGKERASKLQ